MSTVDSPLTVLSYFQYNPYRTPNYNFLQQWYFWIILLPQKSEIKRGEIFPLNTKYLSYEIFTNGLR